MARENRCPSKSIFKFDNIFLVSEGLGGDEGNLVHDPLVGVEVERQLD